MKPTKKEIKEFKKAWGQSHSEICSNLNYDKRTSDDLLMEDYFWYDKQWYPKCSSFYTDEEQEIADYLRLGA